VHRLTLQCLELIKQGQLSDGWIHFERVWLARYDLKVCWMGWLSDVWRRSRLVDGLALSWLDMVKIGWLLANLI
jgi:hypothetical protein